MKFIKDPVHGFVQVPEALLPMMDALPLQRLRHIRQLGFAYLVYPGANHSRFEHALGTMHLASLVSSVLGLEEAERGLVEIAALLHDCGHGPYSHATEGIMKEFLGRGHEDIARVLERGEMIQALEGAGIDGSEVIGVLRGVHRFSGIIHGELDVDRMDYLMRDAHYTGVPYGTVDPHRLIQSMILTEEGIVLSEGGVNAAESLLIARTLMRPAVYLHHVSRIASSMLSLAILESCRDTPGGLLDCLARVMEMDDAALLQALLSSESGVARHLAERLYARQLFKRALYLGPGEVNAVQLQREGASLSGSRRLAEAIAEQAGIEPWHVLVDIPPLPEDFSIGIVVRNRHQTLPLQDLSPLVETLNQARRSQWRAGIYAPVEEREEVAFAAAEVLRVRKPTRQDRLLRG